MAKKSKSTDTKKIERKTAYEKLRKAGVVSPDDKPNKGSRELDPDGLSVKQRVAVERVLIHGNKHRACVEAGLDPENASAFFSRAEVSGVLQREVIARTKKYRIDSDNILRQLGYIANADMRTLFRPDGSPKTISELDEASAAIISGIDVEKIYVGHGKDREYIGDVLKYRFHSKTEAHSLAMRYLKLLDGNNPGQKDKLSEVIAAMKAGPVELPKLIEGEVSEK